MTEDMTKTTDCPPLDFSQQFKEKILSGRKTVSFHRFQHAEEGDIFPFDSSHMLRVTHIKAMQLKSFISLYWSADGFDSIEDACKFFEKFDGHVTGEISNVPDINGYLHEFEVIQNA